MLVTHQHGHRRVGTGEGAVGQQQGVVGKLLAKARHQVVQHAVAAQQAGRRGGRLDTTGLGTAGQGAGPGVFGDGLKALGKAGRVAHPQVRQAQRAVIVSHRLRKVRVGAGVVECEQAPRLAELGKLVGQQLVKKLQISFALAGLGMALGGQAVGQAGGSKAPGLRKVVQHRVVAADLPVSPLRRGQVALLIDPRALGRCQGQALGVAAQRLGRHARLVNPGTAPVQPDGRAGDIEAGAALLVDGAQPVAAGFAVDQKLERLDGEHAGQVHQQVNQVGQAQRVAPRGGRQLVGVDETMVEQGAFKNLVDPGTAGQPVAQ